MLFFATSALALLFCAFCGAQSEEPDQMGVVYARSGRYEEAVAQYQCGLQWQPGNGPVQFNLAVAYYKTGDAEHAAAMGNGNPERALVRMLNAESDAKPLRAAGK